MIIKDNVRRLLKSDMMITQTIQGQKRPLVVEGQFYFPVHSALHLLTTTTAITTDPAFSAHVSYFCPQVISPGCPAS